jgi:hypothetical protein
VLFAGRSEHPQANKFATKPKSAIRFTRLHCALARFLMAGIALGRDLVSRQVDVLATELEEVVE